MSSNHQDRIDELEKLLEKRTRQLSAELAEYVTVRSELEKRTFELNQRIRELKSMLEITNASDQAQLSAPEFYHTVLQIVTSSFQYPSIACAELKIGDEVFRTENYIESPWKMGRGILDGDDMVGYLTVCYHEERPEMDHGPFTKEEKNLMVVITRYLAQIIRRKQSEEQLEKFQQAIMQSKSMIALTDSEGRIDYINDTLTEVLGFTLADLKGKPHIFPPDTQTGRAAQRLVEESLSSSGQYNGVIQVETRDGRLLWTRARVSSVMKNKQVKYFVAVFEDIDKEVLAEKTHRENQSRISTVMENIPVSISVTDYEGRFVFVNKEALKNMRYPEEVILQKTLPELYPKEGESTMKALRDIYRTKKTTFSEVTYHIAGTDYHYEINRVPLFSDDGEVSNIMSISTDISNRKRVEMVQGILHNIDSLQSIGETFAESLRILFDNLFELNWVDGGGLYIANHADEQLELVYHRGLSIKFIREVTTYSFDSANAQAVFAKVARYANPGEFLDPTRGVVNDEKITFLTVLPLVYQEKVVGALNLASRKVSGIDDFDRKALESIAMKTANLMEVIHTREKLQQSNMELTRRLQEIHEKQQLLIQKSKLESLGELAAGLAHEISQPLSVISLAFENILYNLENNASSGYFTRKSEIINMNIEKIRQLIDQVRTFSRDQSSVIFDKVDVNQSIQKTLTLNGPDLEKNKIKVRTEFESSGCVTLGNATKLEQVMMNLIANARDALNEKALLASGKKTGKKADKEILIRTFCQENDIVVIVEDNGTGIPDENLEKVMNPFFTTKPPGQGTGLGLSIVYGIITEMKGTIEIQSEVSKYSRIKLSLPKI